MLESKHTSSSYACNVEYNKELMAQLLLNFLELYYSGSLNLS